MISSILRKNGVQKISRDCWVFVKGNLRKQRPYVIQHTLKNDSSFHSTKPQLLGNLKRLYSTESKVNVVDSQNSDGRSFFSIKDLLYLVLSFGGVYILWNMHKTKVSMQKETRETIEQLRKANPNLWKLKEKDDR